MINKNKPVLLGQLASGSLRRAFVSGKPVYVPNYLYMGALVAYLSEKNKY